MIREIKDYFRPPTLEQLMLRELAQARLERSVYLTRTEHSQSVVDYNDKRIARIEHELGINAVKTAIVPIRATSFHS